MMARIVMFSLDGKSLRFIGNFVKPRNEKYFALSEIRFELYQPHPVPTRGAYHDRHERGTGSDGRGSAFDERRESVRQRRVVLTPRCWRQVREEADASHGRR